MTPALLCLAGIALHILCLCVLLAHYRREPIAPEGDK
jgi:hypothetical protein